MFGRRAEVGWSSQPPRSVLLFTRLEEGAVSDLGSPSAPSLRFGIRGGRGGVRPSVADCPSARYTAPKQSRCHTKAITSRPRAVWFAPRVIHNKKGQHGPLLPPPVFPA